MTLKTKTARSLVEKMNAHFGNKYKVNEEELEKEDDKEEDEKKDESEDGDEDDKEKEDKEVTEEDEKEDDKKDDEKKDEDSTNDLGEVPTGAAALVEKLMKENFSVDNDSQDKAADSMKELAKSDEPIANKMMEALDDCTSAMKIEEDADGEAMVVFEPEKWAHLSEARKAKKKK